MRRAALWWGLAVAFALIFGRGLAVDRGFIGSGDWDYFTSWSVAARATVLHWGQAPTWSPWHCGGMEIPANFQSRVLSPSFGLVLGFGAMLGNRLWALLALALGFEGARRLARSLGATPEAALLPALLLAGNAGVFVRLANGHMGDLPYLLLPWLLLGVRASWTDPARGALVGGLWGALCWVEAGIYPLIYGFGLAGLWCAAQSVRDRAWRPLLGGAGVVLATAALAAPSLLPSLAGAGGSGRAVASESIPLSALGPILLGRTHPLADNPVAGLYWGWHEYAASIGVIGLGLALFGLVRGGRRSAGWAAGAALFLLIALGDLGPWSPWALLHHLPVLDAMRASGRALQPMLLCLGLAAALGLGWPAGDRRARGALGVALALLAIDLAVVGPPVVAQSWRVRPEAPTFDAPFRQEDSDKHARSMTASNATTMTNDVLRNVGVVGCYEPLGPARSARALPPGAEQALLLGGGAARITRWSPGRLEITLEGAVDGGFVVLNQNHAPGWRAEDGREVSAMEGLIAAPVGAGDRAVVFVHRSPAVGRGALIALGTLAVLGWITSRGARARRRSHPAPP